MNENVVVKRTEEALAVFEADAGAGLDGATPESYAIPFLTILQKGSPQVDEASGASIAGARAGMLFDNVNAQLYDGKSGVTIVPCAYRRVYLRWAQTGFSGEYSPEEVARMRACGEIVEIKNRLYAAGAADPETGDRFADVRNHYVLLIEPGSGVWRQTVLSLASTQIKKSRMLMTALASVKVQGPAGKYITPPTFANLVHASTVPESNEKGTWFGWRFELLGFVTKPDLYEAAKAFHRAVIGGVVGEKYADASTVDSIGF